MTERDHNLSRKSLSRGTHFGDIGDSREAAGIVLTESTYAPRSRTPVHSHETASFTMVISGGYIEHFRLRSFECSRERVLFRAAGELHYDRISEQGAHCLIVEFPQEWHRQLAEAGMNASTARQFNQSSDFVAKYRRELAMNDAATPLAIHALTLDLICNVVREQKSIARPPIWLARLRDRLDAECTEKIGLAELARESGHHPAHVARIFRRHYGRSIGEYIRKCRVNYACAQLRAGQPLSTVALNSGFSDQAHFSRVFRAIVGMTPSEYRALFRKPRTKTHQT